MFDQNNHFFFFFYKLGEAWKQGRVRLQITVSDDCPKVSLSELTHMVYLFLHRLCDF